MEWGKFILNILIFSIIVLVMFNLLKKYVLWKVRVNRWIVLAIAILIMFLPALLRVNLQTGIPANIQAGFFVVFFLWFLELSGFTGFTKGFGKTLNPDKIKEKDKFVIRPKAKPNRVKNIQKK